MSAKCYKRKNCAVRRKKKRFQRLRVIIFSRLPVWGIYTVNKFMPREISRAVNATYKTKQKRNVPENTF